MNELAIGQALAKNEPAESTRRRQIRPAAADERQHREGNSLELDQALVENTKRIKAAKGGEGVEPGKPEHALGQAGGLRDGAELSLRLHQKPDGSQLFARRAMGIGRRGKRQAKRAGDPAIILDQPDQCRSGITGDFFQSNHNNVLAPTNRPEAAIEFLWISWGDYKPPPRGSPNEKRCCPLPRASSGFRNKISNNEAKPIVSARRRFGKRGAP